MIGALGALASGLVAVAAAATPALAALGVLGGAGLTALVAGIGVGVGIFAQLKGELEELSPAARAVREEFTTMKDAFAEVFENVGEKRVFPALQKLLESLGPDGSIFPVLREGINQIGAAIGSVIDDLNRLVQNPLFQSNLATILQDNATLIKSMGAGFTDLAAAAASLLAAASPLINRFAQWFSGWAGHIRVLTEAAQGTGKLTDFLNRAGDVGAQVVDIFKNLFGALRDVFQAAAPLGQVFLDSFQRGAAALNQFLDSAQGIEKLNDFFGPGGQVHRNISATWELIKELGSSLVSITQNSGIETLANGLRRSLPAITQLINAAIEATGTFADALGDALNTAAGQRGIETLSDGIRRLGEGFAALAPAVGPLTQIIGDLARNLGDLLVNSAGDVTRALTEMVGPANRIGAALGDILGRAIEALADILPNLLDLLADLLEAFQGPLGAAIEIAGTSFHALLSVLNLLMPVINALSPAISAVVIALAALKIARTIAGYFTGLGAAMTPLAGGAAGGGLLGGFSRGLQNAGREAGIFRRAASGLVGFLGGPLGVALAAGALALGAYTTFQQKATDQEDEWAQALIHGGEAAANVQKIINTPPNDDNIFSVIGRFIGVVPEIRDAQAAVDAYWRSLTPLEEAQANLAKATADYSFVLNDSKSSYHDIALAAGEVQNAHILLNAELESAAIAVGDYSTAIQAGNADVLASIQRENNLSNAYIQTQVSVSTLRSAVESLQDLRASGTASAEQLSTAELNVQQALNNTKVEYINNALAIGEMLLAQGDFNDASDAFNQGILEQVEALDALIAQSSGPVKDALIGLRDQLVSIDGFNMDVAIELRNEIEAARALDDFAGKLFEVDGFNADGTVNVTIHGEDRINELLDKMRELQATNALPTVDIDASKFDSKFIEAQGDLENLGSQTAEPTVGLDDQASDPIGDILDDLLNADGMTALPSMDLDIGPFDLKIGSAQQDLDGMDGRVGLPSIDLATDKFASKMATTQASFRQLDSATALPTADMNTRPYQFQAGFMGNSLNVLNGQRPTPVANMNDGPFTGIFNKSMAAAAKLAAQRPTPIANMNDGPFTGIFNKSMAAAAKLAAQRPTPIANMNDSPFTGIFNKVIAALAKVNGSRPTPVVTAIDNASGTISKIIGSLNSIPNISRSVTITTVNRSVTEGAAASGGLISQNQWTTVGEEGRELVFLSKGMYVASYQKAQKILQAATIQTQGLAATMSAASSAASDTVSLPGLTSSSGSGISIPITVNPSAGMDETELARKTGRAIAWQFGSLT